MHKGHRGLKSKWRRIILVIIIMLIIIRVIMVDRIIIMIKYVQFVWKTL